MRKNQYEEALFRCEDDRYEFEMACEQNASTIRVGRGRYYGPHAPPISMKHTPSEKDLAMLSAITSVSHDLQVLQPFVERISSTPPEERPHLRLNDIRGLSPVHMGHIQRLYGEQGTVCVGMLTPQLYAGICANLLGA